MKKVLALILSILMILSVLPVSVFADNIVFDDIATSEDLSGFDLPEPETVDGQEMYGELISEYPRMCAKADDIVSIAESQIGSYGSDINKFTTWYYGKQTSAAWCAIFVCWCANQIGEFKSSIPNAAACSTMLSWFNNRGEYHSVSSGYTPQKGDIIFFDTQKNGVAHHVEIVAQSGFYTQNGKQKVLCVGGNTSNSSFNGQDYVAEKYRYIYESSCKVLGYAHPSYSGVHQHSYGINYEADHPHREYAKCSCGDWYYTGNYSTKSGCPYCTAPFAPTINVFSNTYRCGDVYFSWTIPEGTEYFEYFVAEPPVGYAYTTNARHGTTTNNYIELDDLGSGEYCIFIHAVNTGGRSAQSNWIYFDVFENDYQPVYTDTYNGHIYEVYDYEMSYSFASSLCKNLGGHLVCITTQEEEQFIESAINKGNKDRYWLGASSADWNNWEYNDTVKWKTGETFSYSNWKAGEPSYSYSEGLKEHFVEIRKSYNYEWNDVANTNYSNKGFIIEYEPSENDITYSTTFNGHTYKIIDKNTTWTEAKEYCEKLGGHLVTINSKEEDSFVKELIDNGKRAWYYLGATKYNNSWSWIDGSCDYFTWNESADNWNGSYLMMYKSIKEMIPFTNVYYPSSDIYHIGFICEIENNEPNVFYYNNHIYEIYDNSLSWTQAQEYCENNRHGHLLTINDEAEQTFITQALKSANRKLYYIGATDVAEEGSWKWVTGEDFAFVNWTEGQPDNYGDQDYLQIIASNGKWDDDANNYYSTRGFICEIEGFTISYNANGGENTPENQGKFYEIDLSITESIPTRTGYTFLGWATSENATAAEYQPGDTYSLNADLTLYAVWKVAEPEVSVNNYTVSITNADNISSIRYAPGEYATAGEIKRADGCYTISSGKIAANTVDGVFKYEMPNGGVYSFSVKLSDGSEYVLKAEFNYFTQELSSVDNNLTVTNLYGVSDIFFCTGHLTKYSDVKAKNIFRVTASKINGAKKYTYPMPEIGEVTVYVKYTDTDRAGEFLYTTLTAPNPTITQNGLDMTIDALSDVKCIRRAYGTYTTLAAIKNADAVVTYNGKELTGGADTAKIHVPREGTITICIQYKSGYTLLKTIEVVQKRPTFKQNGNSVTIGDIDDLYVIRYAKGTYTKANAVKNAPGCVIVRSSAAVDGQITIDNIKPGTYTFLVQYNDQSQNLYTVTVQ